MSETETESQAPEHGSLYQDIVQGLYEAILVTDEAGQILETNARAEELFVLDGPGFREKKVCDIVYGLDAGVLQNIAESVVSQKHVLIEASGVRQDGASFPAEMAVHGVTLASGPGLCFCIRDVTRSNDTEEKLEEARDKLLAMDRIKVRMDTITTLAHEINNPLQSLLNMIEGDKNVRYARPLNRIVAVMHEMCREEELKSAKYAGTSNRFALLGPDVVRCTPRHLLIVDDDSTLLNFFQSLLKDKFPDVVIHCASDGAEALASFQVKHQAVILLDIFMPVMNGEEAFRAIKKLCKEKQWEMPAIIFCTGYIPPDSVREAIANDSLHCYLAKPVASETLVNALRNRFEFCALSGNAG